MSKSLNGKVAIVTGSGQGIGKGIAIFLAREGATVITNNRKPLDMTLLQQERGDIPEEDWKEYLDLKSDAGMTAEIIKKEGGNAVPFYGDVADAETAEDMVNFAIQNFGHIDIIVNNAAGMGSGSISTLDDTTWDLLTDAKMKGAYHMMHFAVPHMIKQKYGRILNCSSDAWIGLPDNDAYSAGNAGIIGLTWASSKELFRYGITVNAYCPQGASPAHAVEYHKMLRNIEHTTGHPANPRILEVVEKNHSNPIGIGPAIAYLASDNAAKISGSIFAITAGGKISCYSTPQIAGSIEKESGLWTVEELASAIPQQLLGPDYVAYASRNGWN